MSTSERNVLVIGGGFVGLTLAARLLKVPNLFCTVIDSNQNKISNFNKSIYGVQEPGLSEIFTTAKTEKRISFRSDALINKFDLIFITIGTPKTQRAVENLKIFCGLFDAFNSNLAQNGSIFLRSTVQIGTTSKLQNYISNSQRKDISVFFAPERTAEGVALKELEVLPQIVGSANANDLPKGIAELESLEFKVVPVSNSDSAEFIKLMCNVWRDSTFAIANDFAIMGESFNLNINELIEKANYEYPRSKIPFPGPVGGPCLSKDTYILIDSLSHTVSKNRLVQSARTLNESLERIAFEKILTFKHEKNKDLKILFLGAAFKGKPDTNDYRESFTRNLIEMINSSKLKSLIRIWDPNFNNEDLFNHSNLLIPHLSDSDFDIVVIGNNSNLLFTNDVTNYIKNIKEKSLVVDMWGVTDKLTGVKAKLYKFGNTLRI